MTDQAAVVKTRDVTGSRYEPPQRSHQEKRWFYIAPECFRSFWHSPVSDHR